MKSGRRINATPCSNVSSAPNLSREIHEEQGNEMGKNGNKVAMTMRLSSRGLL
jgi:hypothetical protein